MKKNYVITHIRADFDAVASAWAVKLLHGCDAVLLATEPEPNVRAFFNDNCGDLPDGMIRVKQKELDSYEVSELFITDCMQSKRLGILEIFLERADKISIYDHHNIAVKDINAADVHVEPFGSCVTVVLKELFKDEDATGRITAFDATLLLMGIYEDTGMLTFSNTTSDDAYAAARLIELGGDVTPAQDYVKRELNRQQVFILNELLMNMVTIVVNSVNVSYSFASIDEYTADLAVIAQSMMDMESLEALFILVRSGSSIVAVGRSRSSIVNTGKIMERFGGGGHATAASAIVKNMELHEAVERLKLVIRQEVRPVHFLRELMNSPAKSLDAKSTFKDALDFTLIHNLNHMPVTSNGETVGILSRKDILQGIKHGLSDDSISLLMQVEFEIFSPDTPFAQAEYAMVVNNQKLLPIEENGVLVGVVTRTDLIKLMYEQSVERSSYEEGAKTRLGLSKTRNLAEMMKNELPAVYYDYLLEISKVAKEENINVYVVGGFVRDLLMGKSNHDIDIVAEGNAILVAVQYARIKGGKITVHDRYKTATVILENGYKIDFATARTEYYGMPGAIPEVESSSLKSDLMRRDFTINAMAIRIDGEHFGLLVDHFGGQRDILDRKIRVLHSMSFVDDPTRAFRAVRFAARLNFDLGSHTERLLKHAENMGIFKRINGGKLFIELKYILSESTYLQSLMLLKRYNMLRFIAINLSINANREGQFLFLDDFYELAKPHMGKAELWQVRFVALMGDYVYPDYKSIIKMLCIQEVMGKALINIFSKSKLTAKRIRGMKAPRPSDIYKVLKTLTNEELLMLAILLGEKRSYIVLEYLINYKDIKVELSGNDLIRLGIKPSKQMGEILQKLLYEKLDGNIKTKDDEINYVRSINHTQE